MFNFTFNIYFALKNIQSVSKKLNYYVRIIYILQNLEGTCRRRDPSCHQVKYGLNGFQMLHMSIIITKFRSIFVH